ncbi:DUF2065 domain-containing protein [Ectothiorhodospiraceae bacterium BW-2]|nr:DUF2065 domain-containing protein [Ectothiorhodospiraceae bacterium BW-2]
MSDDLLAALALVLVIEGLLPALVPGLYQRTMAAVTQMSHTSLRSMGVVSMVLGALLLYVIRH